LSITTSNRIDLFKKTIYSFHKNCVDHNLIKKIFHFDDSSNINDLVEMHNLLKLYFPNATIVKKYFNKNSFVTNKRHCNIMNEWLKTLKDSCDFNFHLEDDWLFDKKFSLRELINFTLTKNDVAYVGVSQFLRDFPEEINPDIEGNFWKWYYDPSKEILSNLFLDTKTIKKENVDGFWCYYINWPHFGFRPGLWDVEKLTEVQHIDCESNTHFELLFAQMLHKKYVAYSLLDSVCEHIGNNQSSYDLNNSER